MLHHADGIRKRKQQYLSMQNIFSEGRPLFLLFGEVVDTKEQNLSK